MRCPVPEASTAARDADGGADSTFPPSHVVVMGPLAVSFTRERLPCEVLARRGLDARSEGVASERPRRRTNPVRSFHVLATNNFPLPTRLRGLAAGTAATALALTLAPGVAAAQEPTGDAARSSDADGQVSVRLKLPTLPVVEVAATPRVWPSRLVTEQGVAVDDNDLVEVVREGREISGRSKRVRDGDTVRVVDVEKLRTTADRTVRAGVVKVPTTKLAPGRRKVVRQGEPGLRRVVALRTLHNGEPVKYRVVDRTMVQKPRPRRVLVGREPWSVPGANGLNWAALAGCESGGNPRAVNPSGYYGLYQFDVGTWRSVGGSGMPHHASAGEQTYRAKLLYQSRGRSPWPSCGRLL